MNEDQIKELAKLPCGVAAIYQNEWVQPILCKIERAATDNARYVYEQEESNSTIDDITDKIEIAELLSNGASIDSTLKDDLYAKIESLNVDDSIKVSILNRLDNPSEEPRMTRLAPIYNALFPEITDAVQLSFNETHDPSEWTNSAEYVIRDLETNDITETLRRDMIQCAVTYYLMNIVGKIDELERWKKLGEL